VSHSVEQVPKLEHGLSAFASALEILTLYAQRPIVEKHARYAFYHPSAEAAASMLTDLPYKIANAILFNVTIYFMVNLNRQAGNVSHFHIDLHTYKMVHSSSSSCWSTS
jgi:ABC-type multidrug transport system permease subunit